MAALAGEVTAALHGSIKKASLEALENTAEVNRVIREAEETILKNTDEAGNLKQTEDVLKAQDDLAAIKQLEEFAGISNIGKQLDSVKLTKLQLEEWRKVITLSGGRIRNILESKRIQKYFLKKNVGAAFDPFEIPPTIWIRNDPSDLELFHEAMHFEDYLRRGDANFKRGFEKEILPFGNKPQPNKRDLLISNYIKEKYVLDKVLEEQQNWIDKFGYGRWSEADIEFSKDYFQLDYHDGCIENGIDVMQILIKP